MKTVAKYNLFKALSTILTAGAPIATLVACGDMFIKRPDTAMSAACIFVVIILLTLFGDKILEDFKMPSGGVICLIVLIFLLIVENVIRPMKIVALVSMIALFIDEISLKRVYKVEEYKMPEVAKQYKFAGFILTTSANLEKLREETENKKEGD